MQIIAMLTMLIDHIGHVFFPNEIAWRIVGRLAFPIYAYCIVIGYQHTRSMKKYIGRLALLGLLSQLPFMVALNPTGINAIGTLLVGLLVLVALDNISGPLAALSVVLMGCALVELLHFDYGAYGLLLVLTYRYAKGYTMIATHAALNALYFVWKGSPLEAFSLASTVAIVYAPEVYKLADRIRVPRGVWRAFYPAHLVVIAVIVILIK